MDERAKARALKAISADLEVEISTLLEAGISLDEIIEAVKDKYGCNSWKFARTEHRYTSCIIAIFEPLD